MREIPEVLRLDAVTAGLDDFAIKRRWAKYEAFVVKRHGPDGEWRRSEWNRHILWELEELKDRVKPEPVSHARIKVANDTEPPVPLCSFREWMEMYERNALPDGYDGDPAHDRRVWEWWSATSPRPDGWSAIWEYARAAKRTGTDEQPCVAPPDDDIPF